MCFIIRNAWKVGKIINEHIRLEALTHVKIYTHNINSKRKTWNIKGNTKIQ